jgi:hypothetical protein
MVNNKSSKVVITGKRRTKDRNTKSKRSSKDKRSSKKQYKNTEDNTSEDMRQILDSPIDVNKYLGGIQNYNPFSLQSQNQLQMMSETAQSPMMNNSMMNNPMMNNPMMNNSMMGNPMMNNSMMGNPMMGNPMMNMGNMMNNGLMSPVSPSNVDPLLLEAAVSPMNPNLMANYNLQSVPNYNQTQFRGMNSEISHEPSMISPNQQQLQSQNQQQMQSHMQSQNQQQMQSHMQSHIQSQNQQQMQDININQYLGTIPKYEIKKL